MLMEIAPAGRWQFRLGRDILWVGNMEDEGADFGLLNHQDEFYDSLAHRGERSLAQRRSTGSGAIVTNFEERMVCASDSHRLGVYGWIKTENCGSATILLSVYNSRVGGEFALGCAVSSLFTRQMSGRSSMRSCRRRW